MRRTVTFFATGIAAGAILIALAIASISCVGSCAGASQTIKTWSGSFAGCEKVDLGQLVTSEGIQTTLLSDVALLVQGNPDGLETDLEQLALGLGFEAVHCAIMATEGVLTPKGGKLAPREIPPGLARAKAWAAKQSPQSQGAK